MRVALPAPVGVHLHLHRVAQQLDTQHVVGAAEAVFPVDKKPQPATRAEVAVAEKESPVGGTFIIMFLLMVDS